MRSRKPTDGISIIIPSLNSPLIGQTLASLLAQDGADAITEILVVGRDEAGLVPAEPRVTFIDTKAPISAPCARNIGIRQAKGGRLIFIDADCIAPPSWLTNLLDASRQHAVVSGSVAVENDGYWATAYNISMFHEFLPSLAPGFHSHLPTINLLVDRAVIADVGEFDASLDRGQDTDWTARMAKNGYRLYFEPRASVIHRHERRSPRAVLRLWQRSGAYSVRIRRRHREVLASPKLFDHAALLLLLSPLIALFNTTWIFAKDRSLWRYLHTFPAVYLTKVAWCLGAASVKM